MDGDDFGWRRGDKDITVVVDGKEQICCGRSTTYWEALSKCCRGGGYQQDVTLEADPSDGYVTNNVVITYEYSEFDQFDAAPALRHQACGDKASSTAPGFHVCQYLRSM